jgi:hypothetical protein
LEGLVGVDGLEGMGGENRVAGLEMKGGERPLNRVVWRLGGWRLRVRRADVLVCLPCRKLQSTRSELTNTTSPSSS